MNSSGKKTLFSLLFIIVLLTIITALVRISADKDSQKYLDPVLATEQSGIRLQDFSGNPVFLSSFTEPFLLIHSWASWCPSCVQSIQELEEFARLHDNVAVLLINRAEDTNHAQTFMTQIVQLPDASSAHVLMDTHDGLFKAAEAYTTPATFIYDSERALIFTQQGRFSIDEINRVIN